MINIKRSICLLSFALLPLAKVAAQLNEADIKNSNFEDAQVTNKKQLIPSNPHIRAGHAKALLTLEKEKYQDDQFKSVIIEIQKLTDNQGRDYLAGLINKADILQYLSQMETILSADFGQFRQQQSARDHGLFHLTVVNPFEYQALSNKTQIIGTKIRVQLHGLGRVSQGSNVAYFVVASSSDGQFVRQSLLLENKDFHVTLGFDKQDVHGVAKNKQTLIK